MAIIQISKIQQRSGNLVDLPQLDEAQFGWATDAKRLFIGKTTPNENIEVLTSYSNISFSQIDGSSGGNFNINGATNGQTLTYVALTNTWENWTGNSSQLGNAKLQLGDASNISIEGGATGYILETDGVGNLAWTSKGTLRTTINQLTPTIVTGSISTSTVAAGSFVPGEAYTITTTGTTDWNVVAGTIGITYNVGDTIIAVDAGSGTGDATLTILDVTAVTSGTLSQGMSISGPGVSANTYIVSLGTGTGGIGTYYVDISQTVVSGTINGSLVMTVANTTPYTNGLAVTISGANATNANSIVNGQTFYVKVDTYFSANANVTGSGNVLLYTSQDLAPGNAVVGATLGSYTANSGIATALISGGGVSNAGGSVNTIQFNNGGVLNGSANFTIASGNTVTLNGTLSVSGNANVGNIGATTVVATNVTGTLTTASQPNITSTGTLASLSVSGNTNAGNINVTGNITPTANVTYDLGNATNAFRDLYLSGTSIKLGTQTVTSNASGVSLSNALFTTTLSASGNANIGNIGTAGLITATGNIRGGNLVTTGVVSATGNGTFGNVTATTFTGTLSGAATTAGTVTTAAQPNITSTGTLASLSVSGNATAGNIITGGSISATGNGTFGNITATTFTGALSGTATDATTAGTVTTAAQPNITSTGTLTSLSVSGNATAGNLVTGGAVSASGNATVLGIKTDNYYYANGVAISFAGSYSNSNVASYLPTYTGTVGATTLTTGANTTAGTITGNWALSAGSRLNATYADLAEYYEADQYYEPGTVLEFGGEKEVTIAEDGTTRVAGVVSTDPAYAMNAKCRGIAIAIALQGRVPCKVRGKVRKGDIMVSAGNGFARPWNNAQIGMVIGKAIENFDGVEGVIEIAVGRL